MTCGLFLILHHVRCVLAIDPGTSTVNTETSILSESGRYKVISVGLIFMLWCYSSSGAM